MSRTAAALGAALALTLGSAPARSESACPTSSTIPVLVSPEHPAAGAPLRFVFAADDGRPAEVAIEDPGGRHIAPPVVAHPGPPWSAVATVAEPATGPYRATLVRDGKTIACRIAIVADRAAARTPSGPASLREWNRDTEALYAAWVEHLFDAPPATDLTFPSLAPVLRDRARNFLHDHLGLDEDDPGPRALPASPDCADLPYLLRAYFAWKLGLPAGFRRCSRGSATAPPRCGPLVVDDPSGPDRVGGFIAAARLLVDAVQSGNARTALDDDATDFYPVPLTRAALRPGTIYADPYGHTLVVSAWLPQTADRPGALYAVDAQPDKTVARKRFWEGTFLFADDVPGAGPGFKAFRPIVAAAAGRPPRALSNAELADQSGFVPFADEQASLDPDAFHARIGALANPQGLDPARAYDMTLDALVEQLETRVHSVDNGERFAAANPGTVIPMPTGAAIFETTGPWEDFATPSRDLRLQIAMTVLTDLPARVERHPELYVLNGQTPAAARADVAARHAQRIAERTVVYTRSDGSRWTLTVADVLARRAALEVAYDPNDCVETRWGAPDGSAEAATCRRHAPADQRTRMEAYRDWFHDGRRPTR